MKRTLTILNTLLLLALSLHAQTNGSNSSYSRYGLGTLNDQSQSFNRGMGGTGIGLRIGNQLNLANPASYSAIDSLSLLFDVGMNVSLGHLASKTTSVNVRNCSLDFANAGFRLRPGMGLSLGCLVVYCLPTFCSVVKLYPMVE